MTSTTVYILSPEFVPMRVFGGGTGSGMSDFLRLRYVNTVNTPGALELVLRRGQLEDAYAQPDYWILVTRSLPGLPERVEGETVWIIRTIDEHVSDGIMVITAESALALVDQREVAFASSASQSQRSGIADDEIKNMVRENMTTTSYERIFPSILFQVEANQGAGPTITAQVDRKSVLQACQDIASDAAQQDVALFFDVVWLAPGGMEFRTYIGQRGADRVTNTNLLLMLTESNLANVVVSRNYSDERTVITALGKGTGSSRPSQIAKDNTTLLRSPWARREGSVSSQASDLSAILADANRELHNRRARLQLRADIIDTAQARYGVDWDWGTRFYVQVGAYIFVVRVDTRMVEISDGQERIQAQLRVE